MTTVIRLEEHIHNFKIQNSDKSKLVEHAILEYHSIKFEQSKLIF